MKLIMRKKLFFLLALTLFLAGCGTAEVDTPPVTIEQNSENVNGEANQEEIDNGADVTPAIGIFQGAQAPAFTLEDLEGNLISLESMRGRQVIVNFWQLSCGPCLAEKKEFQDFINEYGQDEVVILSINLRDTPEQINAYMEENQYTFPVLMDTSDNIAGVEYRVRATPTNVFIDEEGLVKHRVEGAMNVAFMKERLGISD